MSTDPKERTAGILAISSILVTPGANPRGTIPAEAVKELADSITQYGLIEPIVCRPKAGPNGETHELIDGETRFRACVLLGKDKIAVYAWEMSDEDAAGVRMHANLKRWQLGPAAIYLAIVQRWFERNRGMNESDALHTVAVSTGLSVEQVRKAVRVHTKVAPELIAAFVTQANDEETWRDLVHAATIEGHEKQRHWWEHHLDEPSASPRTDGHHGKRRPSQGDAVRLAKLVLATRTVPLATGSVPLDPSQAKAVSDLILWLAGRNAGALDITQRPMQRAG